MATSFDAINGWDELLVLGVAIRMRAIEEMPAGELQTLYNREMDRVRRMAVMRTRGPTGHVRDVEPEYYGVWGPTGRRLF